MPERVQPERRPKFALAGDVDGDVEVQRLESRLEIDLSRLPDDSAEQPGLYYRAALMAARLESKSAVAEMDARAALSRQVAFLREQFRDYPQPPSEALLEARARQSADVDKAERNAAEQRRRWLIARALSDAYAQRGRLLEALARRAPRPPR